MPKHVVLVEDEFLIALVIKKNLHRHGFVVTHFSSGEAFLAYYEGKPTIDVLILDVTLNKGISGIGVFERIQANLQAPVVFTTGSIEHLPYFQQFPDQIVEVFIKPVDIEKLTQCLVRL